MKRVCLASLIFSTSSKTSTENSSLFLSTSFSLAFAVTFDEVYDEVMLQAEKFGWDLSKIHFIDKVKEMDILAGGRRT
ncbi:hypothetical protein DRO97_00330 [Archaeoglobales archaeon]|nr:MAG: hypothetical protein DRO97_00330 [Archaeoglobales archaeon]